MNKLLRRQSSMFFAGAIILSTAACATPADDAASTPAPAPNVMNSEPILIGYAPSELNPTDFFGMFQVGLEEGLQELGIDYELVARAPTNAKAHNEQFVLIEDLITLEADVIIVAPTEFEAQIGSFRAVNEAGIPLFLTNISRPADETDFEVVQYSAYSHEEGGTAAGKWFAENLEPGTKVGIIRGIPGRVDDQRALPAIAAMEAAGIEIVVQEVADFDRDIAFRVTEGMLSAHPDLDFIYAVNSGMAAGARAAIESNGLVPGVDIGVWGFGGTVEELTAIVEGKQNGTIYRNPVEMGRAMAQAIALVVSGRIAEVEPDFNAPMYTLSSCADVVNQVPAVTFGGEDMAPKLADCK